MTKLKGLLLTEGMHGMISQVEGLAKALDIDFTHRKVELNHFWKLIPPNLSPVSQIVFKNPSKITASLSEFQSNNPINENYSGSFLQISASNLETFGGMVDKIEISFYETGSQVTGSNGEPSFIIHDTVTVPRTDNQVVYPDNVSASFNSGMNPTSVNFITTTPDNIMLPTHLQFRFRYLNPSGQYATDYFGNNDVITTDFAKDVP